jgi:hypothetical protein
MKELQAALVTYARSEHLLLRSLEKQADENGDINGGARIGSQEDSDALIAFQNLNRLEALALDDDMRASVKRVKEAFGRSAVVRSLDESGAVREAGMAALGPTQQKIGERIRHLYLEPSTLSPSS